MHNLFRVCDPPPGFFLFFGKNDLHTTIPPKSMPQIGISLFSMLRIFAEVSLTIEIKSLETEQGLDRVPWNNFKRIERQIQRRDS